MSLEKIIIIINNKIVMKKLNFHQLQKWILVYWYMGMLQINKYYLKQIFLKLCVFFKNLDILWLFDVIMFLKYSKNKEKDGLSQKSLQNMAKIEFQLCISTLIHFW